MQQVYMYFRGSGKAAEMRRDAARQTVMSAFWHGTEYKKLGLFGIFFGGDNAGKIEMNDYPNHFLLPILVLSLFQRSLKYTYKNRYNINTQMELEHFSSGRGYWLVTSLTHYFPDVNCTILFLVIWTMQWSSFNTRIVWKNDDLVVAGETSGREGVRLSNEEGRRRLR